MADNSPEMNARRLAAWNAWKEVCWVHGLGKSRGDNLPVVGTAEEETLLADMIGNAFRRQLNPYMPQLEAIVGRDYFSNIDYAQEFDAALCEYEHVDRYVKGCHGDKTKLRKKKSWKNIVWHEVTQSKDPPLKVILGRLLSARSGVIRDLVTEWIFANFSCDEKKAKDGKRVIVFGRSWDAEIERRGEKASNDGESEGYDPNEINVMEKISPQSTKATGDGDLGSGDSSSQDTELIDVPASWKDELGKAFSSRLCCLMLAHINGVKLYADKEILEALGISKATAAGDIGKNKKGELNAAQKALSLLNPELRDWILCDDAGTRFFRKWIEDQCRLENAGQLILSRIEEMSKNEQ